MLNENEQRRLDWFGGDKKTETFDNYVNISHIEQYSYCPEQAENSIMGIDFKNTRMEDGEKKHIKRCVRERFKKSIQQGTIKEKDKSVIQKIIADTLETNKSIRLSEVFVKSEKLKIKGNIDEVRIDNGKVSLVEYKTTFRKAEHKYYSKSAINQIIAYVIAFKEYFKLNCSINLIVKRVYLNYEGYEDYKNFEKNNELGFENKEGKILTSLWDADLSKIVYEIPYYEDKHTLDEIKEIIRNIQLRNFKHKVNPKKCKMCQYNNICRHSLVKNTAY